MNTYLDYLQSPEWQRVKQRALKHWGYCCTLCNGTDSLQVHHRTYEHLGQERDTDVIVLCKACHERHHKALPSRYGWLGQPIIFGEVDW